MRVRASSESPARRVRKPQLAKLTHLVARPDLDRCDSLGVPIRIQSGTKKLFYDHSRLFRNSTFVDQLRRFSLLNVREKIALRGISRDDSQHPEILIVYFRMARQSETVTPKSDS